MSSIKNSKKNDAGNLLPQRRPRLAKYIVLAVMLHVAFVIVYIYFTQRKPEGRPEVRTPPVKVVPLSPPKNEFRRHQTEPPHAPSFRTASHPMTPPRLMALPKRNNVISTSRRPDSPPMSQFIHSMKPNLMTAPAQGVFSDGNTVQEMEAWPEKRIAQRNMRVVNLSESHFTAPSPKRPAQQPDLSPISDWKQLIGPAQPFRSPLKRKQDTAMVDPVPTPAMHPEPYLPSEISPAAPPQHKPFSLPQTRLIYVGKIPQPLIFSKESTGGERDRKSEKRQPVAASLPLMKKLASDLQARKPLRSLQTGKRLAIVQKVNLSRETIIGAVRFETTEKATYLGSEMVWQKEPELLPPLSNYAPLQPELPQLLEDHLADVVTRLIRPALQKYSKPMVRILAKNLTYRDLGLESEGTKFLSGLVSAELEKQDGVDLLSPADVSRNPQIVVEGEMWDDSEKINLRLWSLDRGTGRKISTADLSFRKKMLPDKVEIRPPSGDNLSMIQRIVEFMKRNFPRGGDFQLGVWPDKGLDAVYMEGESLMVYILPEKDAYLHVDYYQIDGKVVHLLPSKHESNYIKADVPYIIGDPKSGGYEFKVSDPFGEELLVVVASQKKLGAIAHGLIEPAEPYIKRLGDSLARQRKKTLMAGSHYIVLTKKLDLQK